VGNEEQAKGNWACPKRERSRGEAIKEVQNITNQWLRELGLELKPSKTRITHTLHPYEGNVGFDFLGWNVRQHSVGKTHSELAPIL
jgi:hypothetical protein